MKDIPVSALDYIRSLMPSVLSNEPGEQIAYAVKHWGHGARATMIVKAAVGALGTEDLPKASFGAANVEYFNYMTEQSLLGQLIKWGARDTSIGAQTLSMVNGATAAFVTQRNPIPINQQVVSSDPLEPYKMGVIVPFSKDVLRRWTPKTEALFVRDITNAPRIAMGQAFLDPLNGGSDSTPASPLYGVDPIMSSGNPKEDFAAMLEGYRGDLSTSVIITGPRGGMELALSGPGFADAGPRGGIAAGLPLICTNASPQDSSPTTGQIVLIDVAVLAVALEGVDITTTDQASLLMSDDPANDSPPKRVSLYQNDMAAIRMILRCNWKLQQEGAISYILGADYSAG